MTDIQTLQTRLNGTIASGKILEALAEFDADDAGFQEGRKTRRCGQGGAGAKSPPSRRSCVVIPRA